MTLLVWGGINLIAWLVLGRGFREFLQELPYWNVGIYIVAYGGGFIGWLLISVAVLGFITDHPIIGYLDGACLLAIGAWNLCSDLFSLIVLGPYGYSLEGLNPLWMLLGACQMIWGVRQIFRFARLETSTVHAESEAHKKEARRVLKRLNVFSDAPEVGRISFTIHRWTLVFKQSESYFALLLPEQAICIRKDLGDLFVAEKNCLYLFTPRGIEEVVERARSKWAGGKQDFLRMFYANVAPVECDAQGRVVIPAGMKEAVGIEKDVVFVGAHRRVEIWNPAKWADYEKSHRQEYGQKLGLVVEEVFGL